MSNSLKRLSALEAGWIKSELLVDRLTWQMGLKRLSALEAGWIARNAATMPGQNRIVSNAFRLWRRVGYRHSI